MPDSSTKMNQPRRDQLCGVLFNVALRDLGGVNRRLARQLYNREMYRYNNDINVICEYR